jgi:hypothetical protein
MNHVKIFPVNHFCYFLAALALWLPAGSRGADGAGAQPVYRVPDQKLTFAGATAYKVIPCEPAMARPSESGQITVAAWVRAKDVSRGQIVLKREGAWQLVIGGWEQPRGMFAVWSPEIHSIMSEPVLKAGEWQHLAGSYDGAKFTLFVNGKAVSSEPAAYGKPAPNAQQPLWIGANLPANKPEMLFDGDLADMAVWDRALTEAEVAAIAANPPAGVTPSAPIAPPAKAAAAVPAAPVPLTGELGGIGLGFDLGAGIRLQRIGDKVASSGGRMFAVRVGGRNIYSDEVRVRQKEVVAAADGWKIPFDLPDGLGIGVLRLWPGGEPGVITTQLELANGGTAGVWRVLFPLVEGVMLDEKPAGELEFFFPFQEGWLGKGECSLGVTYGFRAWLPVLAAWHPDGTGVSLQVRDKDFDVCSLLFRTASPGGKAGAALADNAPGQFQKSLYGESYHPDILYSSEAFRLESPGLTLGMATAEFPLGSTRTWQSRTFAIQVYDGKGIFKTPLSSYGKWARATWWKHRRMSPSIRDMFLSFTVHERVGNGGFVKGFHDGTKYILGDQAEAYARDMGGHPFPELAWWWKLGEEVKSGPYAGRFFPHTKGDYEFEPRFGGAAALRAEIERVHQIGGRVCLYVQGRLVGRQLPIGLAHGEEWAYMDKPGHFNLDWNYVDGAGLKRDYWNFCPQARGWQEHLRNVAQRALTESGADAVRIDSMAETLICYNPRHEHAQNPLAGLLEFLATIRKGVEAAGPEKTMWAEFCGSDAAGMYLDGTLAQGSDPGVPLVDKMGGYGISPFRFIYPEVKCVEWGNVTKAFDYLSKRFLFNGIGMSVSDISGERLQLLTRRAEVLRSMGDVIASLDCEPIVPTLVPGLLANRFSLGDREVYTLWNRSGQDAKGVVVNIPGKSDRRFVELLSGRECKTVRKGAGDEVELALPSGEVAVIGVFPKVIASKEGGSFACPAGMTIETVDLATGRTIASGGQALQIPKSGPGGRGVSVRALKDGYLVQDCVEVSAGR